MKSHHGIVYIVDGPSRADGHTRTDGYSLTSVPARNVLARKLDDGT
jgi:hypothetical protein